MTPRLEALCRKLMEIQHLTSLYRKTTLVFIGMLLVGAVQMWSMLFGHAPALLGIGLTLLSLVLLALIVRYNTLVKQSKERLRVENETITRLSLLAQKASTENTQRNGKCT